MVYYHCSTSLQWCRNAVSLSNLVSEHFILFWVCIQCLTIYVKFGIVGLCIHHLCIAIITHFVLNGAAA
jgi:hypothetical protein